MSGMISQPVIPLQAINLNGRIEGVQNSVFSKRNSSDAIDQQELRKACSELESLFIYTLLKEMRATVPKSGFISGGREEEIYTSMLDNSLAEELSSKGGIGLSSILIEQMRINTENRVSSNIDEKNK